MQMSYILAKALKLSAILKDVLNEVRLLKLKHSAVCGVVYGCPDAEVMDQPGYWFERHGDLLEAGCSATDHKWRMKCDGFQWIADAHRNCSSTGNQSINQSINFALNHRFMYIKYFLKLKITQVKYTQRGVFKSIYASCYKIEKSLL